MGKRKTIYIHIGTPKTGTTSIQRFLTQNKTILAKKDIYYVTAGELDLENPAILIHGGFLLNTELFKEHLDIFAKSEYSTMVLSAENFFLHLNRDNQLPYNDRLWKILSAYEVKIIVYFRQSAEYLTSQWQENIKYASRHTLEEYLEKTNYIKCLEAIDDLSSRVCLNNMIVRTYEPTRWYNHNLIDDFLSIINIEKSNEFLPLKEKQNVSLSRDYCERILFVNQFLNTKSGADYINSTSEMIPMGDNLQTILESLPDEVIKEVTDKYHPIECKIAKKFLARDQLFLTKYPKIYKTKRPSYQLNITSQEIKELRSVISYDLQRQALAKQDELLQDIEKLKKTLTKQENLLYLVEKKLKFSFFYILSKPLIIIFNIIFYKDARKYITKLLFR